jgi:hypothetical protein
MTIFYGDTLSCFAAARCEPGVIMQKMPIKKFIIWLMFWAWLVSPGAARGETPGSREYEIKVAFLYNFAKFVEWPPESFRNDASPFVLGIVGTDPFGAALENLKDKTVRGRRLIIRKLAHLENFEECHILFISGSEKSNLRNLIASLKGQNILTVSDMERFAFQGGMLGLVNVDEKINFEVNMDTVSRSKLKFSSQLLKLAKIVHSGP